VVAIGGAGTVGYVIADHSGRPAGTRADAEARRIAAVLAAPDARMRTTPTGDGRVSLVSSASLNEAVAVLTDLPAPGARHAYQLWLIRGRTPQSVGVLPTGHTEATELISGVRGAQAFGVSREPAGGSGSPTLPLVAQIAL
jgi:anti-sigma-K factor RskA